MSNVERIRVAVLAALIVLALFAVINRKVMWVMWKNVMQGSVTFDDTKNWLGGMSYESISRPWEKRGSKNRFSSIHFAVVSRTMPTLFVFVIMTGPCKKPESSTQWVPVISPFPFRS